MVIFDCPAAQALGVTAAARIHLELVTDTFSAHAIQPDDYAGSPEDFAELQEELALMAYDDLEVDMDDPLAVEQLVAMWFAKQAG